MSGAGFSVGFRVEFITASPGFFGDGKCGAKISTVIDNTPYSPNINLQVPCIEFVDGETGGFSNGVIQAFNYLKGIAPN